MFQIQPVPVFMRRRSDDSHDAEFPARAVGRRDKIGVVSRAPRRR